MDALKKKSTPKVDSDLLFLKNISLAKLDVVFDKPIFTFASCRRGTVNKV